VSEANAFSGALARRGGMPGGWATQRRRSGVDEPAGGEAPQEAAEELKEGGKLSTGGPFVFFVFNGVLRVPDCNIGDMLYFLVIYRKSPLQVLRRTKTP